YGGNCHVIPNHAVMVMAWAYGQQDFHKALKISVSAGWDTDCNAANVGTVSALVAGLDHLCDTYDFRSPCGDRIVIPTAEGTFSVTDILTVSNAVAELGRRVMGWASVPVAGNGALFSFEMPGAWHGFLPEEPDETARGNAVLQNIPAPEGFSGSRALQYHYRVGCGLTSRISKPLTAAGSSNAYQIIAVPLLYSGNTVSLRGRISGSAAEICCFLRTSEGTVLTSEPLMPDDQGNVSFAWTPEFTGVAREFGLSASGRCRGEGDLQIDWIDFAGRSVVTELPGADECGWISSMNNRRGAFSNDADPAMCHWISNHPNGVLITGNRRWGDRVIRCNFAIHSAERAGILCCYQGLRRWIGVLFTRSEVQIVRNLSGETVLARAPFVQMENQTMALEITVAKGRISVAADGKMLLEAQDDSPLRCGGAGLFIGEGLAGMSAWHVEAEDAGTGMVF
ncbi:MAG: ADP-ribosylglycohydrolase family protein, partial [Lentisphaeria bacterium]|nr:ADP-ribosylglycohydrolase family protein [Lentisphaeria bacterium]